MTVPPGRLHTEIRELCVPFARLPSLVGRSFVGDWFIVDARSLPLFDRAIYTDQNPYPLDASGYPEGLVEGFHLLALLDHLVNPLLRVSDGPCVAGTTASTGSGSSARSAPARRSGSRAPSAQSGPKAAGS